ncbi:MAG: hypothetical protein M1830_001271 [Pleopsidium flavum]|nr:MAG: hypothetical protein M1830_001271 [Pleopsidium flavum]
MGILDYPSIAGSDALGALSAKYFCSLAAKYADIHPYVQRIAERCKNGKKGDNEGPDMGAGQASPSPPVGPALGSKGVKSMDFCKEFNARTAHMTPGVPIPARVTVRPDRSFHFDLRTPSTSHLLLTAAGVKERKGRLRGSMTPGKESVGQISLKHVYEIAKIKHSELRLSGLSLEGLCRSVIAQAQSTGVSVVP